MQATRILNVNDNEISRYTISRVLKQEGFEILEAGTGMEALQTARVGAPDLILLDIRLPDIDGYEVCRRLRTDPETVKIPIIHVTAHALATENRIQSLELGADAYLTIPVERPYLTAVVNSLLRLRRAEAERERLLKESELEKEQLSTTLQELQLERNLRDQFVAALTHDLRTPLTAIRMTADLLKRQSKSEDLTRRMGRITDQVTKMDRMIQDLLDVTVLRAGRPLPVRRQESDLCELVQQLVADYGQSSRVKVSCSESPVSGLWDGSALQRLMDNLIQNALKYGNPETPVTVAVTAEAEDARIDVHNHGNPIPVDRIAGLFEPFQRMESAKQSGKVGWGLGLTLVKGVVDAHGGEIQVESSPASGTTFSVIIPRKPKSQALA